MKRIQWTRPGIMVALVLLPCVCWAWGTLTERLPMTPEEESTLRFLVTVWGRSKLKSRGEVSPRRGPHPVHQFIVKQAYMLLEKDPAYKDTPWKLPKLNSVLIWDGIARETGESGGLGGMWERSGVGTGIAATLAPPKAPVGGPGEENSWSWPSADAEITTAGVWNPEYMASEHYWNPWLPKHGRAPAAVAKRYVALIKAMTKGGSENAKAKAVSHLGHFLTDAVCPKHGDMIELDNDTLLELCECSDKWFAEHNADQTMRLNTWLESKQVRKALNIIIKASGVPRSHPYWKRVDGHIAANPLLNASDAWTRYTMDVAPASLEASVAGFLAALHQRRDRDLVRFFGFFDPFYYNGQIVMQFEKVGDWTPRSIPEFGLVTPASEHLMWETDPSMGVYINNNLNSAILGDHVATAYVAMPWNTDRCSPKAEQREAAYSKVADEFVRDMAYLQHRDSLDKDNDFTRGAFQDSLALSVKSLFSVLRSTITAIRCKASYAYFPEERKFRVYCDLGNVAGEALQVKAIRIAIARDGKLYSSSKWVKDVSCSVSKNALQRVTIELPSEGIAEEAPLFYVDVFGRYEKTPDLGFWRGKAEEKPPRIMHGMSLPAFDRVTGALDLAICFDVTGSMSSSINSVRSNAIAILTQLKARLGDVRVALVSFRDIKADKKDVFSVTAFSSDIPGVIAKMKSWRARGGGDAPEDQLQAIRLALDMWARIKNDSRKPTKIVVVITDAPPHDPDVKGNTQAFIADYAERVDPAHIYPIVVGSDLVAHSKAASLAKMTGGEVLTAKSGDEVASVLAAAVEKAVAAHGHSERKGVPPWVLFYGGLTAMVIGALWFRRTAYRGSAN